MSEADSELRFPCSLGQGGFWAQEWLSPGNPASNIAVRWRLVGTVSTPTLERAFGRVLARHEILRSSFGDVDGEPWQTVLPAVPHNISEFDLTETAAEVRDAEILRLSRQEARRPFDLASPPLIRLARLILSATESILLVTVHHITCDGWSIGIIARDLGEFCRAEASGTAPRLDELPLQYGDYCLWEQEWLASSAVDHAKSFWQRRLSGFKPVEILPDYPRKPVRPDNGAIASLLLDRAVSESAAAAARLHGCTLFTVAVSALMLLMKRYTGETDLAIGTQVAGRNHPEVQNLVGIFINTLILRADLGGDPTVDVFLKRLHATVSSTMEHAELPLGKLIEIIRPKRDPSRHALVGVNFIFQRSFVENADYGAFQLVDLPSIAVGAMYDLNFFMVERPEGWRLSCEYNTDLYQDATVRQLLRHFETLLGQFSADSHRRLSTLEMLNDDDRSGLIRDAGDRGANIAAIERVPPLTRSHDSVVRYYAADLEGHLVPRGGVGELLVGSDDATALAGFDPRPDPFLGSSQAMVVTTGIRARRTRSGDLELLEIAPSAVPTPNPTQPSSTDSERTETERRLGELWASVLGLETVDPDANFFDLGGHSMTAARLLRKIELAFDRRIGLAALFESPTIRQLAVALEQSDAPSPGISQVIQLNRQGSRPPLIAINNTGIFYALARRLGPDQPVTMLQLFDPNFEQTFEQRSFEAIARDYVSLIRRVQPTGPYTLIGWCLGGSLAFEVACQLAAQDGVVPRLITIDTWVPGYFRRMWAVSAWIADHNYRWQLFFSDLIGLKTGRMTRREFLANRPSLGRLLSWLGYKIDRNDRTGLLGEATPETIEFDQKLLVYLKAATKTYQPKILDGNILAFRSSGEPSGLLLQNDMGWGPFARRGVSVVRIEGDHFSVFRDPGVSEMADWITGNTKKAAS